MSHGKIREDKTCLNCGNHVEERFCPHCGQENIETRQPFHYLFTHFIEDFTHYDGQFWKTIKYLLIRPGKLTKEYLAGKRQLYVAPVKLYIFISFITFLLPALLPSSETTPSEVQTPKVEKAENKAKQDEAAKKVLDKLQEKGVFTNETAQKAKKIVDSIQTKDSIQNKIIDEDIFERSLSNEDQSVMAANNEKEYDSLMMKDKTGLYKLTEPVAKKVFELQEKGLTKRQIFEKYKETLIHTIPKALFVYLPIFAFFLWVFHNKKKWWYFDHGIFTLHYFSFLLLATLILIVASRIWDLLPDYFIINAIFGLFFMALLIYASIYFFVAHHRVYESSRSMSVFKGSVLFIINFIGVIFMLLILMYISLIILH